MEYALMSGIPYPGSMTTGTILLLPFFSAAKLNSSLQLSPALSLATLSMYLMNTTHRHTDTRTQRHTDREGRQVRAGRVRLVRAGSGRAFR